MIILAQQYELISSVVLDVEIASIATVDAISISQATSASDDQSLSIARAEAWRQLRARNVFPHDIPIFEVFGDPVSALSPAERTLLALSLRLKVSDDRLGSIVGMKHKDAIATLKEARRQLARAAIAMTLMTNETRCPVTQTAQQTLGATLKRAQAMHLVTHAAECSICVPVLRTVDRQIVADYAQAAVAAVPADLESRAESVDAATRETLVSRSNLKSGWAPADENLSHDPRVLLKRAAFFGAVSAVLVAVGLVLAAR